MTNIKNLEIIKAALIEKRDAIELTCSALEKEAKEEKKVILEKLFADELVSYADVAMEMGYSGIYFKIGHKEIGSINERGYGATAKELYFNTYATTCDSEFEFKRLIFNGKIALRMLTNMDSIKEAFATPFSKKEELDALSREYNILSGEIKQKDYQMTESRKQDILDKLNGEGVELDPNKYFEFARQWSSYSVKKVRIVNLYPNTLEHNKRVGHNKITFSEVYRIIEFQLSLPQNLELTHLCISRTTTLKDKTLL